MGFPSLVTKSYCCFNQRTFVLEESDCCRTFSDDDIFYVVEIFLVCKDLWELGEVSVVPGGVHLHCTVSLPLLDTSRGRGNT